MAKQEYVKRHMAVAGQNGIGQQTINSLTIDDNLLPSPSELQQYKEIDPRLVEHLMNISVNEQSHRHNQDDKKLSIVEEDTKRKHNRYVLSILLGFIIIISGMAFSAWLIYSGIIIQGSIFAGGTLIMAVSLFILKTKEDIKNKDKIILDNDT